ncbi:MAG: cystathionine beta-lyase [Thermotogae bacterium]|nr:MalY/PatB family protein [Kosmotoga sp.]MBO8166371.1 pyridoxal phosphate-dependent aminotransferase [Kosmotoga sp.]MCD6159998.1 pyridoxal phosphate-dependent aminotransferase [Kosmotoga sp.]RKX50272.1 MAG: cystathionine beta-lyase [Thermotogota bacterium]
MKYDFDEIINRRGTSSYKWDKLKELFGRDELLPMWVADMDFKSPPAVIEALTERAKHGVFGYTARSDEFYQSFMDWVMEKHGWRIKKRWVVDSPGVVPAIAIAIQAFTNPGDKILVQTPVYYPFFDVIKNNNRKLVTNELLYVNGHYEMDFNALESEIDGKTKMLILCNPHNPVGRVWSKTELKKLGEICLRKGIIVVSDEIHSDIVYSESKHTPFASISNDLAEISITCMAPSKTFNIAGLETSLTIIPNNELRKSFEGRLYDQLSLKLGNIFGIYATEAAYRHGKEWLDELLDYLEDNRNFAIEYINDNIPGVKPVRPEGTYLMWLDFRELGLSDKELQRLMIHKAGIALTHGPVFGKGGEGFQRLNFACPRTLLKRGLKMIERAVKELKDD